MTLEQAFPGLAGSPAGTAFAVADDVLNIAGPANEMMRETLKDQSGQLITQIKALDPSGTMMRSCRPMRSGIPSRLSKACKEN